MQSELTRSPSPERTEFQSYSADLEKLLQKAGELKLICSFSTGFVKEYK